MVIISQLMVVISPVIIFSLIQWPFQEPKLEVPTIYKAYVRGYTPKIWPYMVQYLHFRILKFPLIDEPWSCWIIRFEAFMETRCKGISPMIHRKLVN